MKVMRLLVFFDLPTGSKAERRSYSDFRKFLIEDGYHMEQFSVYSRLLLTRESVESHIARLRANLPLSGEITVLELTEKQYEKRRVLLGTKGKEEKDKGAQLTLLF